MAERRYISVIVPLRLEWEPCYWTMEDVAVGDAVKAPLGGREYIGVVSAVGVAPTLPPARIREVGGPVSGLPRVSQTEIALWRQMAEYYMCSIGEVFKAARPAGLVRRVPDNKVRETVKKPARAKAATGKSRSEAALEGANVGKDEGKDRETLVKAALEVAAGKVKLTAAQDAARKEILAAFAQGKPALLNGVTGSGKTEIYISLAVKTLTEGKNVLYLVPEIALSRQLESRLKDVFGDLLIVYHSGETPAKRRTAMDRLMSGKPYIVLGTRSAVLLPHHDLGLIVVDEEQDSSYKQDAPAPRYNGRDTALMLGTLQSSHKIGNSDTPADSAQGRKMGNNDKSGGYEQERKMVGKGGRELSGCNMLLGSATPSLESLYNCMSGKYIEVRLSQRYFGADDPLVEIIDTAAERRKRGMKGSFSLKLTDRIREYLSRGEQVMILRARRGYAPVLQCSECGRILRCPRCNVSLTFHRNVSAAQRSGEAGMDEGNAVPGRAVCHHCGYSIPAPARCPECGGEIYALGAGTQKIEEEAAELFPEARIARLDSDVMQSRTALRDILARFSKGEIDILIGTQVVTKGFDFGNLSLVAVLQSDTLLSAGDFRADEKALSTLMQFGGRCGRRDRRGSLVIQTAQPDHPVYASLLHGETRRKDGPAAANGNGAKDNSLNDNIINTLLAERKEFGYPPYTRLINITIRHNVESAAEAIAGKLAGELSGFEVRGPSAPPVDKEGGQYVRVIGLSLPRDKSLAANKRELSRRLSAFVRKEECDGAVSIDVDPA